MCVFWQNRAHLFRNSSFKQPLSKGFFLLSSVPCPVKFTQNSSSLSSGEYVFARRLTSKSQSSILINLFCFESFFQSKLLLHGFPNQQAAALKWKKKKIVEEQEDKHMAAVSKISVDAAIVVLLASHERKDRKAAIKAFSTASARFH